MTNSAEERINKAIRKAGGDPEKVHSISVGIAKRLIDEAAQQAREEALPSEEEIEWFCKHNGSREVHRSWRDHMLLQEREVSDERMEWETLPPYDKLLDEWIAKDVIMDFIVWLKGKALMESEGEDGI